MGGPLTVAALAAQLMLSPSKIGAEPALPQLQLPSNVKPNRGPVSLPRSPEMQEGDAVGLANSLKGGLNETLEQKNQRLAKEYAGQLQENFPDQISK